MAKLNSYTGSVTLISGLTPKNNGTFPLMEAKDIQVEEDGTRLDAKLAGIDGQISQKIDSLGLSVNSEGYLCITVTTEDI